MCGLHDAIGNDAIGNDAYGVRCLAYHRPIQNKVLCYACGFCDAIGYAFHSYYLATNLVKSYLF